MSKDAEQDGWKYSPHKALCIRVARLRRVVGLLLRNLDRETHLSDVASIHNQVKSQLLVVAEHSKTFEVVACLTTSLEVPIRMMQAAFNDWSLYLLQSDLELAELSTKMIAEQDGEVWTIAAELRSQIESLLEKLVDVRQSLKTAQGDESLGSLADVDRSTGEASDEE